TGHFEPEDGRSIWRRRIMSHALRHIRAIDAGGSYLDKHFSRFGLWSRALSDVHLLGTTRGLHCHVTHVYLLVVLCLAGNVLAGLVSYGASRSSCQLPFGCKR